MNLSAPRVQRPAVGDLVVQVTCTPVSNAQPAIGGLLLWQDETHYLRLDRGGFASSDIDRTIYHGAYPDGTAIRFESFHLWQP